MLGAGAFAGGLMAARFGSPLVVVPTPTGEAVPDPNLTLPPARLIAERALVILVRLVV